MYMWLWILGGLWTYKTQTTVRLSFVDVEVLIVALYTSVLSLRI